MPMMFGFARQRRQLLAAELQRILPDLSLFGARRVYLIGEFASGTAGPATELELVLIQATDEPFHRRADFWVTHLRPRVGTRFLVYTPQEFEALAEVDPVLQRAQRLGEVIVG
ncbi:MAG TPA: hypothetical protein VHS99_16515 [Chloroflexota bacterium]|jgi:hypothetical protein|nr:hypothetical protein [Chloroflexota bacterium]